MASPSLISAALLQEQKMQHTQGPWTVKIDDFINEEPAAYRVDGAGGNVAVINTVLGSGLADARLIAAAPALLKALERIATGQEMTDAYGLADVITRYQRIAMEAIAKATNA